eukprot:m.355619 g.355619  ORF g.355619 m.355619 type:complete len:822 (+) comp17294_c0_seq1:227-2692(+)
MAESHGNGYSCAMGKARKYDISETNVAQLDSPLAAATRQEAAESEKAWQVVNQKRPELRVWRIEQFKVVPVEPADYGSFYNGDSYIILHSYFKEGKGALQFDIHFWIGSDSSQDEYGTAAYKTVELDDFLGGIACQHREVQDHESRRFKSIFRSIIVMEGGVATGFRHVKPKEYRKRLLHIKGKLNTIAVEVPIALESLNSGDSFIFDAGLDVYVWHGKKAGLMEKNKAANLAQALDDNRGGMCTRHVFDEDDDDAAFFKAMGIKKGPVAEAEAPAADQAAPISTKKLVKISDESGTVQMTDVASGDDIRRDLLNSSDVFLLDDGYEVMVWVGRDASLAERRGALNFAAKYLKDNGKPMETPISKIFDGGENEIFEAAFEVGVKSGKDGSEATRSKEAAQSVLPSYKGSGGPGVVADLDELYAQNGVDPEAWGGRSKAPSLYALELQSKKVGAYSATSGWVSGMSQRDRDVKQARIAELEKVHAANRKAREASGASTFSTIKPYVNFSARGDAEALYKAMKGLGTNNKKLIKILARRTLDQRARIAGAFEATYERSLEDFITKDTSGNFRTCLLALVMSDVERRAYFLYRSVKGWGTDERLLVDILCTKEADEILKVVEAYKARYPDRDLEADIVNDTSGDFRKLLVAILACKRPSLSAPVDAEKVKADAQALFDAGEKKWGTDESKFIEVLTQRSYAHIKAVVTAYEGISDKDFFTVLKSELSSDFLTACTAIAEFSCDPSKYVCTRLFKSMEGWGTADLALINLIVEHAETDMDLIKERFPSVSAEFSASGDPQYLAAMIKGDTSGHYQKLLLALIGEN